MVFSDMKTCKKCGLQMPREMFHRNARMGDGLAQRCKLCEKKRKALYYKENREKVIASNSAYHEANKSRRHQANANWRAKNADRIRERMSSWKMANHEKVAEKDKKWKRLNRTKVKISNKNMRLKRRGANGKLSFGIKEKLFKLQRGKCACCGLPLGDDYHLDHIMPIALGGTNTDDNAQLLRARCNLQKQKKHPVDFMKSRGFLL